MRVCFLQPCIYQSNWLTRCRLFITLDRWRHHWIRQQVCEPIKVCACFCPHMLQSERLPWLGSRGSPPGGETGPQDNVRETRGRTQSTALFLSHLFFQSFRGVAALSTATLTRSGCGVGLIHLALCVCLEQTSVIENSCKRSCWNQHCVWERVGKRKNYQNNSLPNLSTVSIPIRLWAKCSKSQWTNDEW